jgi:hypothetical protein
MKIQPVGPELFHADRYTDRQREGYIERERQREKEGRKNREI